MLKLREATTYYPPSGSKDEDGILTWRDLARTYESDFADGQWIFRGHDCLCRDFTSSLERAMTEFGYDRKQGRLIERNLLKEFKRRAHHYVIDPPELSDTLQWLALMRHYGAPSRLLDWTYSFWVAAFFAVECPNPDFDYESWAARKQRDQIKCETPAHAIWAIDAAWCRDSANQLLLEEAFGKEKDRLLQDGTEPSHSRFEQFLSSSEGMTYPVSPFRLNERIVAQQGVFLCPSKLEVPFDDSLARMSPPSSKISCVKIAPEAR